MTLEQWQQVKELFESVFEQDPAQRTAFLDQACPDDSVLRAEVESLLVSHSDAENFFDTLENIRKKAMENAFATLRAGQIVAHYRIVSKIGEGGMGEVYKAEDLKLGRTIAMKVLCSSARQQEETRRRLLREARSAATLHHPNIVTIFSIEETEDMDFIAMEYVEGQTLKEKLEGGPLDLPLLTTIALQVSDALNAAHSIGLIHRDIKPENIMINSQGKVKVLDFGLAKMAVSGDENLTGPGIVAGTVAYMSPEQVQGQALDQRSDIFSLGCVLYRAATGKIPFEGSNLLSMMHAINTSEPARPSSVRTELTADFDRVLLRAMAKEKEQRYQSVEELGQDLKSMGRDEIPFLRTTILFIEVIDVVLQAAEFGRKSWQKKMNEFEVAAKQSLKEFEGREVVLERGALLVIFENPLNAIVCGSSLLEAAQNLGISARAGLHSGEFAMSEGDRTPDVLKTCVRVSANAAPGEILVSSAFRKAVAGSEIIFQDRGSYDMQVLAVDRTSVTTPRKIEQQLPAAAPSLRSAKTVSFWSILMTVAIAVVAGVLYYRSAAIPPVISSIAVLPFTSASVNPNVQYFSDGITENIISQLSQISDLKVMARGTVFAYKGTEVDPRMLGRNLDVDAIVTGSIFQQGEMLIINVNLVRVSDGSQIWGEQYIRKISDLLTLQAEIPQTVFEGLRPKLKSGKERSSSGGK